MQLEFLFNGDGDKAIRWLMRALDVQDASYVKLLRDVYFMMKSMFNSVDRVALKTVDSAESFPERALDTLALYDATTRPDEAKVLIEALASLFSYFSISATHKHLTEALQREIADALAKLATQRAFKADMTGTEATNVNAPGQANRFSGNNAAI